MAGGERAERLRGDKQQSNVEREVVTKAPKQKETDTKLCVLVLEV